MLQFYIEDCGNESACLTLTLAGGDVVRLSVSTDSCSNFGINGVYYNYRSASDWDNREFFECFDAIPWNWKNTGEIAESERMESSVGVVNTTTLRVREEPSEDSNIIALIKGEQEVTILEERDGFYRILVQDEEEMLEGYVRKEYITVD